MANNGRLIEVLKTLETERQESPDQSLRDKIELAIAVLHDVILQKSGRDLW